jgi:hypothetical protein
MHLLVSDTHMRVTPYAISVHPKLGLPFSLSLVIYFFLETISGVLMIMQQISSKGK